MQFLNLHDSQNEIMIWLIECSEILENVLHSDTNSLPRQNNFKVKILLHFMFLVKLYKSSLFLHKYGVDDKYLNCS